MKKVINLILAFALLILASCSSQDESNGIGTASSTQSASESQRNEPPAMASPRSDTNGNASYQATTDAENSARNARDRDGQNVTPEDQGTSGSDRNITKAIRQSIVIEEGPDAHSVAARNIKIITADGAVTLRGIVRTEGEKLDIQERALKVPGVTRVDNQLEVVPK